jgi:hypothetical protein
MESVEDLFAAVRQFKLFAEVQPILLNLSTSLKSKVWTLEILTRHLNEIVEKFLSSEFNQIQPFFAAFLIEKFNKDSIAKQRFCYTLLMSLFVFEEKYKYVKLYAKLLGTESDYAIFHCFWELKDMILDIKGVLNRHFTNLDNLYLGEKHWQLLLKSFLGHDFNQILEFRKHMQSKIQNIKREGKRERVLEFTRNDEYCASFFIKEVLGKFHEAHILEKYRENVFDSYAGPAFDRKSTLERNQYTSMIERMSKIRNTRMSGLNHYDAHTTEMVDAKAFEKERLIAEIKQATQLTNSYKHSAIKLTGYVEQIDPILLDYQQMVKKIAEEMQIAKERSVRGSHLSTFKSQLSQEQIVLMETGSSVNSNNAKKLKRTLLNTESKMYKNFEDRLKENRPALKKLIQNLRSTIFSQGFDLANDNKSKEVEVLKEKIKKLFGSFGALENSQVLIVDTVFQNIDLEGSTNPDLLFTVSEKIDKALRKGLNEEELPKTPIDEEIIEKEIRESFKADLQRYETLRKETASWQENLDPEFRKNRYSTKPLNEKASDPIRESLLGPEIPASDGSSKPALLNFAKNKATDLTEYVNGENSQPSKSSTANSQIALPSDINAGQTSEHPGAEIPLHNRDSNIIPVKDQLQQTSQRISNHPVNPIGKSKVDLNPSTRSSAIVPDTNNGSNESVFKKKKSEIVNVRTEKSPTTLQQQSSRDKSLRESNVNHQQKTEINIKGKQSEIKTNTPSQPSAKQLDTGTKNISMSQKNVNKDDNFPFESKISVINVPPVKNNRADTNLSDLSKNDMADDPPRERPSLRLTISQLSKIGSDRDSIKRVSVKKELSEIALPRNQSILEPIPEFLKQSDVDEIKDKGPKTNETSSKYNSNVPLMNSKEGVMFAQEIGLIDEQPKTIKNFFSNFWGKK